MPTRTKQAAPVRATKPAKRPAASKGRAAGKQAAKARKPASDGVAKTKKRKSPVPRKIAGKLPGAPVPEAEKPWFDGDGLGTHELLALAGTYRVDSLVSAFELALERKQERVKLSPAERCVLAVEAMEREVNNGGFNLFFMNSSTEFAPELVEALRGIRCPNVAALAERALHILGMRPPFTREDVEAVMQKPDKRRHQQLDACDQDYFKAPDPIATRLLEFIRANAATIRI